LSVLRLCAASSQWLQAMVKAHMFDTLAKSVLSYGCEMQGISDALQHINLLSVCTFDLCVSHVPLFIVYRLAVMFVHEMEAVG